MRPIKINKSNTQRIDDAISEAQGKATARTINTDDVFRYVTIVEDRLSGILHKKDWVGITVGIDPHAQHFPASYKYTPESTGFTIEYRPSGWFLVGVGRGRCGGPSQTYHVSGLREKADLIADFISKHF